jgi:hypothetical protein
MLFVLLEIFDIVNKIRNVPFAAERNLIFVKFLGRGVQQFSEILPIKAIYFYLFFIWDFGRSKCSEIFQIFRIYLFESCLLNNKIKL